LVFAHGHPLKKVSEKLSIGIAQPFPHDFDLLSIDVDGNDYHVWNSIKEYHPSVVIVEINNLIKPNIEQIHTLGSNYIWGVSGTSISSMTHLAMKKGYALVSHVGCNVIYIKRNYLKFIYEREVTPLDVFTYETHKINELMFEELRTSLTNLGYKRAFRKILRDLWTINR